jgi:hypothetical protein
MMENTDMVTLTSFRTLLLSWLLMWGLSYIACAILAPNIMPGTSNSFYALVGIFIILCVTGHAFNKTRNITRVGFFIFAILETFSGVGSYTGAYLWNVPFQDLAPFQVSMAFADLISAAMMFWLALTIFEPLPDPKKDSKTGEPRAYTR